jgi:hypothetical protein
MSEKKERKEKGREREEREKKEKEETWRKHKEFILSLNNSLRFKLEY